MVESTNLTPKVGDIVEFIENDNSVFKMWTGTEWDVLTIEESLVEGPKMTVYDMNKQIVAQMPELDSEQIQKALTELHNFIEDTDNKYYMLLNNENRYYTVFVKDYCGAMTSIEEEVIACANYIGQIKAIDLTEDESAFEIWITTEKDTFVYYFFPYDLGVIECL